MNPDSRSDAPGFPSGLPTRTAPFQGSSCINRMGVSSTGHPFDHADQKSSNLFNLDLRTDVFGLREDQRETPRRKHDVEDIQIEVSSS